MMRTRYCFFVLLAAVLLAVLGGVSGSGQQQQPGLVWVEDSFEDFRDGQFSASGANLYATRKGTISTVKRFDLNGDGHIDLVFNSSHDEDKTPAATSYELPAGRTGGKAVDLPVWGSNFVAVADLNKDGFLDAVLAPNDDGVNIRRYLTVLWGDRKGWSERRSSGLISIAPKGLQIADWDGDGWPDIVVLNGSRWAPEDGPESVLRIYWGSADGYDYSKFLDVVLAGAQGLKVQDLDGDGRPEAIVLGRSEVLVYWNSARSDRGKLPEPAKLALPSGASGKLVVADLTGDGKPDLIVSGGTRELVSVDPTTGRERYRYSGILVIPAGKDRRSWEQPRSFPAPSASSIAIGDLNRDGSPDLVLADSGAESDSLRILWGKGNSGFQSGGSTVPVAYASAVAISDLDSDGNPDLVVGVSRSADSFQGASRVFFGDGKGGFETSRLEIPTADVTEVVVAPGADGNGSRLVFANNRAGRTREDIPVLVYWGGPGGPKPERVSRFSIRSGYSSAAADLNNDGHPDLVLLSIVHATREQHPGLGFNILWGGIDGLKDDRRNVLLEYGLWNLNIGDVDRDGYLDLIGMCSSTSPDGDPPRVVIWHGGPQGFDRKRRVAIRADGGEMHSVLGDFNKDGWLDIATSSNRTHGVEIFWGSPSGYSRDRHSFLALAGACDLNLADLDGDGWPDLLVSTHKLPNSTYLDFGTYIFWGGPDGFRRTNAQRLVASSAVGIMVADFDKDGFVDIYVPTYHLSVTRQNVPSHIYWGSADGYSKLNRTALTVDAAHAALAADFNQDGLIDLAVANHTRDGTHFTQSRVFFNDGRRFARPQTVDLPTVGPHFMYRGDVGNQNDRSYRETYISSVFAWDQPQTRAGLAYKADIPGQSRLEFSIRTAASREELSKQGWSTLAALSGAEFTVPATARCLQYKAEFISDNGDRYPVLDRVEVRLSNTGGAQLTRHQ